MVRDTDVPTAVPQHLNLNLPAFSYDDPSLWFLLVENKLNATGITDDNSKFIITSSALPMKIAAEVRDVLEHPGEENKYDTLKAKLVERLSVSERERVRQLLSNEQLGTRRPSQLYRDMLALLGGNKNSFDENILKEMFIQRMPSSIQQVLVGPGTSSMTIQDLANTADRILEVYTSGNDSRHVHNLHDAPMISPTIGINAVTSHENMSVMIQNLMGEMKKMNERLNEITTILLRQSESAPARNRSRTRSFSRPKFHRSPSANFTRDNKTCFYHSRYGVNAKKCYFPCSFKSPNQENSPSQ